MFSFLKEVELPFKIPTPTTTIRVAVTGLSRSGKTVFLTSFINQLLANDKLTYLNEKLQRPFKAKLLPPSRHYARFDYYAKLRGFRETNPSWPEPTKQVSKTTLQLEIKSEYTLLDNQIVNIELIDYPGEWLLDLSMLELDYKTWSTNTLALAKESQREVYAQEFLDCIKEYDIYAKDTDTTKDEILFDTYSEYLKTLHYKHFSFVQPGRFLEPGDMDGDPLLLFAPLPLDKERFLVHEESIYARFEKRYDAYLEEVVKRLYVEHFSQFDTQIILVDLVKTLQHGKESFEDMHVAFKHIIKSFTYGRNSFLNRFFSFNIAHVIFAATKADYIPPQQHNSYKKLLEKMINDLKNGLDLGDTETEVTVFSALKSTEYVKAMHQGKELECVKGTVVGEKTSSVHFAGKLPANYNDDIFWKDSNFNFPLFKPRTFPKSDNEAVAHIRMDRIIYSILKDRI